MPIYYMSDIFSPKHGLSEENNTKMQTKIYMYLFAVMCLEIYIFIYILIK